MAQVKQLSRYEQVQVDSAKRKQAMQQAIDRSAATRASMVNHINTQASNQVTLTEQVLRSKTSVRKTA